MPRSTKTFGHELGWSCCFRQWRATSHCNKLHGYALSIKITFEGDIDENNWVVDFGGLKSLRARLADLFDHTTLVAEDDPELQMFRTLARMDTIQLHVVPATGCEAFARTVYNMTVDWLNESLHHQGRVRVVEVEVREHGANSAIWP